MEDHGYTSAKASSVNRGGLPNGIACVASGIRHQARHQALHASLNTSSFFLISSPWTLHFLHKVYNTKGSHIPDINDWWENAAMIYLTGIDASINSHIKFVSGRLFNAWPPALSIVFRERNVSSLCKHTEATFYQAGDFAVHFVGKSKKGLSTYLQQASINIYMSSKCGNVCEPWGTSGAHPRDVDVPGTPRSRQKFEA